MNRKTKSLHTASSVSRVNKGRVQALGRGACSKNKLQSPSAALSRYRGRPTNGLATRLGKQQGAIAQSVRTPGVNRRRFRKEHSMHIGNWNVFSIAGKELELVEEAKCYRLDIVGVSSTKRRGSGTVDLDGGWKLFYSGVDLTMSARAGVGILICPRLTDSVVDWIPLGGRVCLLKLKLKERYLWIVQVYAPNHESQYQPFLDEVTAALAVVKTDSFILLGDFNAHVGTDDLTWRGVIGRNGDPDLNANGRCLLDFCSKNSLSIMNTFFQHRDVHRYTWYRNALGQRSLIDFHIVSADLFSSVLDVCVKRGAELSTDHHLVVCHLELSKPRPTRRTVKPKVAYRIKWESLEDDAVRKIFVDNIASRYKDIPEQTEDIETECELFNLAVITSAVESCGRKRLSVAPNGEKRTPWWNQEVKEAIRAKKVAYRALLQNKSSPDLQLRYTEARIVAAKTVKVSKERVWESFGERLDSNFRSANKVFWQTIRRLRGKKSSSIPSIKDPQGVILTREKDIAERMGRYFGDLLNPIMGNTDRHEVHLGPKTDFSEAEVGKAISSLKAGKAAGEDGIRPEMLKALNREGILWLTRVCQVAWNSGKAPKLWQTGVVIPIYKKGDKRECSNYRGISLLSLPGKVYAKCLERRSRVLVESKLADEQCGFRPGRSTTDQIFTLRQIFEKSWEYTKEVYACFVDLEKAYDRVPRNKLWGVLEEYEINGQLLAAIKSLYKCPKVCVRVNGIKSRSFTVGVGLRQGCVLSPLLFIIYMNWIDMRSRGGVGVEVGNCRVSHLLFADDMVLLCSSKNHLQHALDRFATECCNAGMKISTAKSETLVLSRNPAQCTLHVSGATLKQVERFKYLGITFTSDGKSDGELDARIGGAGAVLHQLRRSVVIKRELGVKAKLAIFNSVFIPILTYGHELWIMTERMRSRVQAAEMGFLRSVAGLSLFDRVYSTAIREFLSSEPLLLRIERSQLRWYGHVIRMSDDRIARRVLLAEPTGRRPRGRPRTRWLDYINNLVWSRLGIPPQHLQEAASDRSHWRELLGILPPRP